MAYEERDMSGSLFQNRNKKSENHPTMQGTITIRGEQYRISGWTKHSEKAGKWLSLAVSEMGGGSDDFAGDDEAPF